MFETAMSAMSESNATTCNKTTTNNTWCSMKHLVYVIQPLHRTNLAIW